MQRDIEEVKRTSQWARENGKIIGMQVNSGCLRQCPFQQFHDNLHGHNRIRQSGIGANFDFSVFRCRTTYGRKNFEAFLKSTWIRPEDVPYFEPYIDVIKLATRRIKNPTTILNAYASYSFDGNLLDLMDPIHSDLFAPKIIDNKSFPEDWITSGIGGVCANNCSHCGRCSEVLSRVLKERGNV
jgi:ferredoxin